MKNFLDGYVVYFSKKYNWFKPSNYYFMKWLTSYKFFQIVLYSFSFGLSIGFAIGNPSCFLVVLEYFTSMGLNLENGVFIAYMLIISTKYISQPIPIPLKQPFANKLAYIITCIYVNIYIIINFLVFFSIAIFYDIFAFIQHIIDKKSLC